MKRIGFLCESVLSIGGVQRVLAVIAIALSKEYDVTIISMNDNEKADSSLYNLDKSNVHIRRFSPSYPQGLYSKLHHLGSGIYKTILPKNDITSQFYAHTSFPKKLRKQFIEELNNYNFDAIIAVHGGLSMKLATIRQSLSASKVIGWMHNSYDAFFENTTCYYPGLASHFSHQMKKLDDFVVLCHADADRYNHEMGLSPTVIYNPLTVEPGMPCDLHAKHFLSIGRMTPLHKGFDILIKAFSQFAKENKEWQLDIVGEGPEETALRTLIKEEKMDKRIHLHPFTQNIQAYYSASSVYVLASRWEGFGLVLIEAMSHGLPVVCSSLPVTNEIMTNSQAIFFEKENVNDLAEKLKNISERPFEDVALQSKASLQHAKRFFPDQVIDEWKKLI